MDEFNNDDLNKSAEEDSEYSGQSADIREEEYNVSQDTAFEAPSVPSEEPEQKGKKLYIPIIALLISIFIMTAVLTVYFIYTDIRTGSIEFNKKYASNENSGFSLDIYKKPGSGKSDRLKGDDEKYTTEELAEYIRPQIVEIYAYNSTSSKGGASCGSGIIISEDGYIITNTHILEKTLSAAPQNEAETPDSYVVITSDDKQYNAKVIGRDKKTDIAVIKIEASGLPYAELGDSDETAVGEHVVAIGNPEGFVGTVTEGIVSGLNRQIKAEATGKAINCIQTDAAINYGSSGGALVNMYGQIIGITSSKYAMSKYDGTGTEGLGFAISINYARPIIEDIISQGYVSGRVRVGITFLSMDNPEATAEFKEKYKKDIPENLKGLWITDLNDKCDVSKTELKAGDFILKVNGKKIQNYNDLCAVIEDKKAGDKLKAECARIDENMNISYFDIEFKLMEDTSGDF